MVGCTIDGPKSFLGDDAAVLARSSGEVRRGPAGAERHAIEHLASSSMAPSGRRDVSDERAVKF